MTKSELIKLLKVLAENSFNNAKKADFENNLSSFGSGYDSGFRQGMGKAIELLTNNNITE